MRLEQSRRSRSRLQGLLLLGQDLPRWLLRKMLVMIIMVVVANQRVRHRGIRLQETYSHVLSRSFHTNKIRNVANQPDGEKDE